MGFTLQVIATCCVTVPYRLPVEDGSTVENEIEPVLIPPTNEHDGGLMVSVNVVIADVLGFAASSQVTPNVKVPATVGVPDNTPLLLFNVRPGGRTPDATTQLLIGGCTLVAWKVNEYGIVVTPAGRGLVEVITGTGLAAWAIIAMPDMMTSIHNEIIYFLNRLNFISPLAT